ncbi:ferredoxin--NADP reductase [Pseudomonas aeruginosa]|uniref:ferredoxin--NADP reductase n=1 Tax=Pseudomonas aeruginosa TaxID=287 RepID=UPI001F4051DD|nr:ferredoxin--NADP reductase [Pseudomonas aeruginosa]MDG3711689.1 ferredoxin--NADP reductase [Pseudomonas aeruginosa]HBP1357931.1 ferredoxin--NADP reductase [Pseudomonas aeruginosa]
MGSVQSAPGALDEATGSYRLRVARVIEETADTRSLVLEVPAPLAERFAYRAGQFLTFRVTCAGQRLTRCYSMSSAPEADAALRVTVKRVAGGRVSNWMNEAVVPGDELEVLPPAGSFHLGGEERDLILFGGGSGITPVFSILKSALFSRRCRVCLVYANRDEGSVIFREELRDLAKTYGERLQVIHVLDSLQGFLGAAQVRHLVGDRTGDEFFICGPGPFMETVASTLLELGVERARVHVERFVSPADPEVLEAERQRLHESVAGDALERLTVNLDGIDHEVPCEPGETLLQSCRRAGLAAPASCEEGVCGACMCRVELGDVLLPRNAVLSAAELADGWTLACQGRPRGATVRVRFPD